MLDLSVRYATSSWRDGDNDIDVDDHGDGDIDVVDANVDVDGDNDVDIDVDINDMCDGWFQYSTNRCTYLNRLLNAQKRSKNGCQKRSQHIQKTL